MLVVKIELHGAISGKVTEIGRMLIANTGGTRARGDYQVKVLRPREIFRPGATLAFAQWQGSPVSREGEVKHYPRLSYNVWRLVLRALKSAFPEESGDLQAGIESARKEPMRPLDLSELDDGDTE